MSENFQKALVIFIALFFCAIVVGYNAFYNSPINLYQVYYVDNADEIEQNSSVIIIDEEEENSLLLEDLMININTATVDELIELPGIGDVMAGRIIEYREIHAGFSDINEIKNISGIGEITFEAIKNNIFC